MARNVINIFATGPDLVPGIRAVESSRKLQYVLCGMFDLPGLSAYGSLLEVPGFGTCSTGDHIREPKYLVANAFRRIEVRAVPQRAGGTKYGVDQLENPGTITILPGGVFGDTVVLAGQIATVATDPQAIELFRDYSRAVTKGFRKVHGYLVGPAARSMMEQGARLTTGIKTPTEYDLKA
jgi:hypothetical protein